MDKIRVADFIIDRLNTVYGVKYISLLTGNGALVINDAIAKNKDITPICVFHEQDAGYFALGYSKYTNGLSVVNPTTGCAGTNCITPLLAAYQDHCPILFLSGNVALNQTTRFYKKNRNIQIKKLGVQECDIIEIVKSITKYAVMVEDCNRIKHELDKCVKIALTPPFGPVWLDVPANIGSSLIDPNEQTEESYNINIPKTGFEGINNEEYTNELKEDLKQYDRPVVLIGNGIRLSDTKNQLENFIQYYKIPVISTYGGIDILGYNHELYGGVVGVKGNRSGNFILQNSNLLIVLGACLNVSQVGYMGEKFAHRAKKYIVDLDCNSFIRDNLKIDRFIMCELKEFFNKLNE